MFRIFEGMKAAKLNRRRFEEIYQMDKIAFQRGGNAVVSCPRPPRSRKINNGRKRSEGTKIGTSSQREPGFQLSFVWTFERKLDNLNDVQRNIIYSESFYQKIVEQISINTFARLVRKSYQSDLSKIYKIIIIKSLSMYFCNI